MNAPRKLLSTILHYIPSICRNITCVSSLSLSIIWVNLGHGKNISGGIVLIWFIERSFLLWNYKNRGPFYYLNNITWFLIFCGFKLLLSSSTLTGLGTWQSSFLEKLVSVCDWISRMEQTIIYCYLNQLMIKDDLLWKEIPGLLYLPF